MPPAVILINIINIIYSYKLFWTRELQCCHDVVAKHSNITHSKLLACIKLRKQLSRFRKLQKSTL